MYEENNQYQNYNSMPYDNTAANRAGMTSAEYTAAPQGNSGNNRNNGGNFWKKIGTSAACALVFGVVAGVTMTGVNSGAAKRSTEPAAVESTVAAEPETAAPAAESAAQAETGTKAEAKAETKAETRAPSAAAKSAGDASDGVMVMDVSGIVEKAMPSVVAIDVRGEQVFSDWFGRTQTFETEGAGSGILIGENDTEYLVVTNNHVVANTTKLTVQFIDGETAEATVKGTDSGKDVAVVSIKKEDVKPETKEKIIVAEMGDSDSLKVGQGVIAIGNALGYGQSVTVGYVSALNRSVTAMDETGKTVTVENLLQTDAAINPGNSGGALLDMDGRVIGINESKSVDTSVEGMGYAIPISTVKELIQTLSTQKAQVAEEKRGFIGFQGQNVDSDAALRFNMPEGIFVYKILEDGAAALSQLQENDIIVKMDGMTVKTIEELREKLSRYEIGETVTLTVERPDGNEYKEMEIQITLAPQGTVDGLNKTRAKAEEPKEESQGGEENKDSGKNSENYDFNLDDIEDFFRNGGFQFRW